MYEFIAQNPIFTIVFILVVAACVVYMLVKTMQTIGLEEVRGYVYQLFVRAEHIFEYGQNVQKFEYVVQLARSALPAPFNMFITESLLRTVIQTWFDLCKDLLDDGKLNMSEEE